MIIKRNIENTLPDYSLDELTGVIEIRGRCISLELNEFFEPILEYLKFFVDHNTIDITANVDLEYFNTKGSRILLRFFEILKQANKDNENELTVKWYYDFDDEEMLSSGEDFEYVTGIPFQLISK